jgi:hypothetical protein
MPVLRALAIIPVEGIPNPRQKISEVREIQLNIPTGIIICDVGDSKMYWSTTVKEWR